MEGSPASHANLHEMNVGWILDIDGVTMVETCLLLIWGLLNYGLGCPSLGIYIYKGPICCSFVNDFCVLGCLTASACG